jgi:hypothetical protein
MAATPPNLPPLTLNYATPVIGVENNLLAQSGGQLVAPRTVELPAVCIKCNAPEVRRYKKTVHWHHPAIYLVLLANIIIYAIVAAVVQKKATYTCGLCAMHVQNRKRNILIAWLIALAGLGVLVLGIVAVNRGFGREWTDAGVFLVIGGIATILGALILGVVVSPILRPKKIDQNYAYYGGAAQSFLEPLPVI